MAMGGTGGASSSSASTADECDTAACDRSMTTDEVGQTSSLWSWANQQWMTGLHDCGWGVVVRSPRHPFDLAALPSSSDAFAQRDELSEHSDGRRSLAGPIKRIRRQAPSRLF